MAVFVRGRPNFGEREYDQNRLGAQGFELPGVGVGAGVVVAVFSTGSHVRVAFLQ
jgi:hypothetical protein